MLVGRSSILIKGLSSRLKIPWSLSHEWAPIARKVLKTNYSTSSTNRSKDESNSIRFRDVIHLFKSWGKGKVSRAVTRLPPPIRTRVAAVILRIQKRQEKGLK